MVSEPKRSKQPELCCGAGWITRHSYIGPARERGAHAEALRDSSCETPFTETRWTYCRLLVDVR
jgi:hypothetical protein